MDASTFRIVKAEGRVKLAKVPPESEAWFSWPSATRTVLAEETEAVEDAEEEEPIPNTKWTRRQRSRYSAKIGKAQSSWVARHDAKELVGHREGSETKYFMLRETKAGVLEATEVDEWLAFRPKVDFETLSTETAEKFLVGGKLDITQAVSMQPWRARQGDPSKKKSSKFARLGAKLDAKEDAPKRQRARHAEEAADIFSMEDAGHRGDVGLNAAGDDGDAFEAVDGRGDDGIDFDQQDEFDDDEADEEKQDVTELDEKVEEDEGPEIPEDDDDDDDKKKKKKSKREREDEEPAEEELEEENDDDDGKRKTKKQKTEETEEEEDEEEDAMMVDSTILTEADVRNELVTRGGKAKAKELIVHFKTQIKADPANKKVFKKFIKDFTDWGETDPLDGHKWLVLRK